MNRTKIVFGLIFIVLLAGAAFLSFSCAEYPVIDTTTIPVSTTSTIVTTTTGGSATTTTGTPATTTTTVTTTTTTTTTTVLNLTWVQATGSAAFPPVKDFAGIIYPAPPPPGGDPALFIFGGTTDLDLVTNEVWYSTDGATWNSVGLMDVAYRRQHTGLVYNGKIWIIGGKGQSGLTNEVGNISYTAPASSALGSFTPRKYHASVVFANKMWVIGGVINDSSPDVSTNDAWSSTDGTTWTNETLTPFFPPRSNFAAFVFNGKIWVIGGLYADQASAYHVLNDVWSTADGQHWIREGDISAQAPVYVTSPEARAFLQGITFEAAGTGYMALTGGATIVGGSTTYYYDGVRYSVNGTRWISAEAGATYPARINHVSLVNDGKIWVIGGSDGSSKLNDVWYAPIP
ncbi:MAG: kelch repeat-containing protein [Candidatus Margulisiibacteriota bacterium]